MPSMNEFKVVFRGARGSYPASSANMLKYGASTSCVEVRVNGHLIILDAGTGIISLGNELIKEHIVSGSSELNRKPIEVLLLFSHMHNDHIQGFPFFKPAYINTTQIHTFGPQSAKMGFEENLTLFMQPPFSPVELKEMSARIHFNNISETDIIILNPDTNIPEVKRITPHEIPDIPDDMVVIENMRCYAHPKDGVTVYKISWKGRNLVYATDKEGYLGGDSKLRTFARKTDLLIHDAQYTYEDYSSLIAPKQGFGHSTPEMAIEAATQTNARKLVLFHHNPEYNDEKINSMEENSQKQFSRTLAAYEGLEINLL
jgi:phosphoribosyl 1,2-cyclic phosphodiesterase